MTTTADGHNEDTVEIKLQSMEMRLLIRRRVTTLAIVVLALLAGSVVIRAQNDERPDNATSSMPKGSKQSQANDISSEIIKMLRAYYDSWTKLDDTLVNSNHTDDCFVSIDGKMISSAVFKSRVRLDFASTPAMGNYHFEVESLIVFQADNGTAVANYRLASTPSNKKLTTIVENITDIFVRRDGRWLMFAEQECRPTSRAEPGQMNIRPVLGFKSVGAPLTGILILIVSIGRVRL